MPNMRWPIAGCVLPVPDDVDLVDAAGLPEALFTAWTNIIDTGRLKPGESAAHPWRHQRHRQLAIQMFAARGHTRLRHRRQRRKNARPARAGRHARHQLHERGFRRGGQSETGGKGVDVILDMVGGDPISSATSRRRRSGAASSISPISRAPGPRSISRPMLMKRLTLVATTLRGRSPDRKGAIRDALLREVWPLVADGPHQAGGGPDFPLAEAQKAHEYHGKRRPYRQNSAQTVLKSLCASPAARLKDRIPRKD